MPQLHGSLRPVVETFVVAVDEQHGIGARLQPSDVGALLGREIPRKGGTFKKRISVAARLDCYKGRLGTLRSYAPVEDDEQ